jgi:glycosyltransferase involved in cell wall biosynthesis
MSDTLRVAAVMEGTTVTGPAKNLIEFARRGRQSGAGIRRVELSLITYRRAPVENVFVEAAKAAGIEVDLIEERGRWDASAVAQLRQIVERRKPHLVQTHQVKSHFFMRCSGLWRSYPWLGFHHGYTSTDFKMLIYNQVDRWSLRKPVRVVTVCEPFAQQLRNQGVDQSRICIRHNSVKPFDAPPAAITEELRQRLELAGKFVFVVIGRLSHEKGHVDLLEALSRMPERNGVRALIVGEGPERARIEEARKRLELERIAILEGHRNDVRPYLAVAGALALPSHSEGSPNVLLEAMAAGVPAVACAVGGVPEIAHHEETALLVEPRNPQRLAEALERVRRESAECAGMVERARRMVEENYTPEAYHRSLVSIYEEVLSGPHVMRP